MIQRVEHLIFTLMELLFKSDTIQFYKLEDGILFMKHLTSHLSVEDISTIIQKRIELSKFHGLKHLISDHSSVKKITHEAKQITQQENSYQGLSSLALIGNNPVSAIGFNILIKLRPAAIPMRGFSNLESALQWTLTHHDSLVFEK